MKRYHSPNFYRRFHRSEIAGTITASFTPENAGVLHPTEKRLFSVRESARIQSFPDWFVFHGTNVKAKLAQIGNAVPPRLAYELAVSLKSCIIDDGSLQHCRFDNFEEYAARGFKLKTTDPMIIMSSLICN